MTSFFHISDFAHILSFDFLVCFVGVKGGWKHQVCPFFCGILGLFGSKNGPQKWPKIANEQKMTSLLHISDFARIRRSALYYVLLG